MLEYRNGGGRFYQEPALLETDLREVRRYMGMRGGEESPEVDALAERAVVELIEKAAPAGIFRIVPLVTEADGTIRAEGMRFQSRSLWRNLAGCERLVLMAATLGAGVDRLLRQYSRLEVSRAVALQAAAAAMLEEFCDCFQEELGNILKREGLYLRPRFSPGYGDFSLEHQKELVQSLQTAQNIGLTLTGGCMMAPTKSVTAVIGAGREAQPCHRKGCEACGRTDCAFRRE